MTAQPVQQATQQGVPEVFTHGLFLPVNSTAPGGSRAYIQPRILETLAAGTTIRAIGGPVAQALLATGWVERVSDGFLRVVDGACPPWEHDTKEPCS